MNRVVVSIAASAVLLVAALHASAAPILITSSSTNSRAFDGPSGAIDTDNNTLFGSYSLSALSGSSSSNTSINWLDIDSGGLSGALLDFDFDHTRSGEITSFSQTYSQLLYFNATADTTYSLSGTYSTDAASEIWSFVRLYDLSAGTSLFRDISQSFNTANESFTLGDIGDGDFYNENSGSLNGNLIAGNNYFLYFNYYIAAPHADDGATATGCLTLAIGDLGGSNSGNCGSSVPEPMPLTLLGAGIAALGLRRRLRVKAA